MIHDTRTRAHIDSMTRLGGVDVPRVFLGDHGFLRKLGSGLSDEIVLARLTEVITVSNLGLAAGEERLLALARRAEAAAGRAVCVMYHTDLPIELRGHAMRYQRCGATLLAHFRRLGLLVEQDPVLGYLKQFDPANTLTPRDIAGLSLSISGLEGFAAAMDSYRPAVVTIGGDWLDMLLLCGGEAVAADGLAWMATAARSAGAAVAITLYVGALVPPPIAAGIDALMLPLNEDGVAMLPNRSKAIEWAIRQNTSLIGMHVLGRGLQPVQEALRSFFQASDRAAVAVVGASRSETIGTLIRAVDLEFGEQRRLVW